MIEYKSLSSLEKVFPDSHLADFPEVSGRSALKGERISFQLGLATDEAALLCAISLAGDLAPFATVRMVTPMPVTCPVSQDGRHDDNYLRKTPGLYPDLLEPLRTRGRLRLFQNYTRALFLTVELPDGIDAGKHTLTVTVAPEGRDAFSVDFFADVIDARLPEQKLKFTEWFHADCLADYYNVPVFSDEHFRIVENFARVAVKNGINMLLTPLFTPPLDTAIGGERTTTQLVGVTVTKGEYSFDFSLLDRWIDMCDRVGVKYFEIAHLYTQWGVAHAPKVVANVDGEVRRIFGWETEATGDEYKKFLREMLTAFLAHMKARGDDKRCYFHISDEPQAEHLEAYRAAKAQIADLLEGYPIMDALSNYEFWQNGVVSTPIPASNHIKPFLDGNVPGLWTYYCSGQNVGVSNRYLSMPSWRNRFIGVQWFKYRIVGFLQWGFNFYNNCHSYDIINPFLDLSGDSWVPAGDTCSVYPGRGGVPLESLRVIVFHEAIEDLSAMQLCAELYGHEAVVAEIEKIYGAPVVFDDCAKDAATVLKIRERINEMIRDYKK